MTKAKLTYFDISGSRGEECRLALHLAGIEFEDNRIKRADWAALKPTTPFGSVPILELPGKPPLAQSNAILVLIGRRHDLHPADDFEAAQHLALMEHVKHAGAHRVRESLHQCRVLQLRPGVLRLFRRCGHRAAHCNHSESNRGRPRAGGSRAEKILMS